MKMSDIKALAEGRQCAVCEMPLRAEYPNIDDHEAGQNVEGYERPQWVAFSCIGPDCNYLTSLNKLLQDLAR